MLAVAGSRSRADMMISVRPPLSSVIERSAATFSRSLDAGRRLPGNADGEDDEGVGFWGTARAPGNAEGTGFDFGALDVFEPPDDCDDADEYDEVEEPEPSMPIA